ncbi:hypothetical protein ABTE76_19345, partial [Acinetobacter baumannii]
MILGYRRYPLPNRSEVRRAQHSGESCYAANPQRGPRDHASRDCSGCNRYAAQGQLRPGSHVPN